MKANQTENSKQKDRKDIFEIKKTDQKQKSFLNPEIYITQDPNNILNLTNRNNLENGGLSNLYPQKRSYRDLFLTNIGNIPNNNNISNNNNNMDKFNRKSINYSFYNEPSLINKIRRDENLIENNNNNNLINNNVIINNLIINNSNNNNIFNNEINNNENNQEINQINNDIFQDNKNEEEQKDLENKIEIQKKIINEYNIIEKIIKDDQNLFLNDNCHISNSNEFEKIPEELSSFIISKRVNFPKELEQDINSNSEQGNENENQSEKYTVVYSPLNCIIFVEKNNLLFFNYINENTLYYTELPKPIKKLLITTPKPGMFINDIKYIMICIMEGEIQLLTLAFKNIEDDLPIIHKTDFIFSFNETVIDIISTANHRIFISTLNNKIFELDYTVRENNYFNFFGSRNTLQLINKEKPFFFGLFTDLKFIFKKIDIIHKLKVDNTRNILYALKYTISRDEKKVSLDNIIDSTIIIFDLGIDGKGFNKVEEISQEDLGDYGLDFNGFINFNYMYSERDINENNNFIQKSNVIVDIAPLTRDKYKDYHLLIMKRNGHKIFLKFNTFIDDSNIKNQDEILKFNKSAFCRERITDRFISVIKRIPISKYNNFNNNHNQVLYDIINYFPFSTFCYYNKNKNEENLQEEFILNVIEDDFSNIAKKENIRFFNQNEGLKETEQILFKSTTKTKELYSIVKLSDYNLEDCCGLGNLLKHSNNLFMSYNTKYIDNSLVEAVSYNCMHEYAKQLFYSPEEFGMLFNDEFIIFKRLRPIDTLIEIIQFKNIKINLLIDNNNINNKNDIMNNSANDFNPNLISNQNSNDTRRKISMPLLIRPKGKLNNPFQINKEFIIKKKFKDFINIHGYIETTVMLLNIITNNNFCYYIKNSIENPNYINNFAFNINNNDNNISDNILNRNDLQRYYLNPYSLIKSKNDNQLMNLGQEFLLKLLIFAKEEIDIYIFNYQNLLQSLLNNLNLNMDLLNKNNNNNFRVNFNNNINNIIPEHLNNNLFDAKNFISYGFILFLSRIIRLFWEENIFIRQKLYFENDNFEFNIVNNLNQNQIMFIKNMLIKFINDINQYKIELLQQAADISSKSNKLRNHLNDIDQFLNNNSGYTINEIKKKLSIEEQNILNNHKKTLNYFLSIFNFEKFNNDLDIIINIANRVIELLTFLDTIYKINITKELQRRKSYNILNIKIKDLFRGNYPFIINELLQIIFELYITEKNMEFASIKIQEIIQQCPNIINRNEANAIEGNFILRFCNYNEMDNIDKIKYLKVGLEKINLNLLSVKIEEVVNYLSKFQDITNIINLCLKKGKLLQPEVNSNIDNNAKKILSLYNNDLSLFNNDEDDNEIDSREKKTDINKIQIDNNISEFYKCIGIILNILNYLHNSIKFNSFEKYVKINSPNANIFSYPLYINNLLSDKTPNDYKRMENIILNLVFNEEYEYIHYNIIDFLKENKIMNKLQEINSPSIEKFLNNQININNNSPQSLFSMFEFYFRNKNYSCATKILANLINYRNLPNNFNKFSIINDNDKENNINYVSLNDRITYVNTMLRTLELQIKDAEYIQLPEQKMKEIQDAKSLKEKMINIRNILNIQYEIKSYLNSYINNANNNNIIEEEFQPFIDGIIKLDNEPLDLNTLYKSYAKKFSIFDSCMAIFFQIKFSNTNNKIDPKEVKNIYCEYFCKFDNRTLALNWPFINFERFDKIFNTLIKEKTQYQNFYNMLQNNGMKNKYRDIIPLEFIISIIESMNRRIIFNDDKFINGDNYLMKIRQNFQQSENPFWFILYLKDQIFLPLSYIFNEYYKIYLSLSKESIPKMFNNNININDLRSNRSNSINNDNLSFNTFNSNNLSVINDSGYEEYGMIFDGNLNADLNKKISQDAKLYCIFLLLGIVKLWVNRLTNILDNNNYGFDDNKSSQDQLDLKQFNLEIKKNGNQKIKNLFREYFEELKKCKLIFSEQKYEILKKYGEFIEKELNNLEERLSVIYPKKNSFDNNDYNNYNNNYYNNNENENKILKINVVKEQNKINNYIPFSNSRSSFNFINLMGKK